jgi:hypothetical protein
VGSFATYPCVKMLNIIAHNNVGQVLGLQIRIKPCILWIDYLVGTGKWLTVICLTNYKIGIKGVREERDN